MAKRLTAFVVDVGPGMREREAGAELGDPTPLQKTISDLVTVLQRKIFSEEGKAASTRSEVCIVLFGTDETDNPLADEDPDYYKNITLSRRMCPASWELVDHVTNEFPASESKGDFLEAIIVAVNHFREVQQTSKAKQFHCDVVVFSNLKAHFGESQLDDVVKGLTKMDVELKVIGPQFDGQDDSQGTKHERRKMKTEEQKENEALVDSMLERGVAGGVFSFEDMATVISSFQSRMKAARPLHYTLEIGSSFAIPVSLFTLVAKTRANDGRPWKDFYARDPEKTVQKEVSHVLDNESRDEVSKEERIRMWAYGSRLVPITDDELKTMSLQSGVKDLKLVGFTSLDDGKTRVPPFLWTGDSVKVMLPRKDDDVAAKCYKALLRSMIEQNAAMILRYVYQANSQPRLVLGVPTVRHSTDFDASAEESEVEILQIVNCPFAEDLRDFQFPSLETEKWKPKAEEDQVVDALLDEFDLGSDEADLEGESFCPELTLNPYLQRLYRCLNQRALRPDAQLPSFDEEEEDQRRGLSLAPRPDMVSSEAVEASLSKVKSTFGLKKILKKKLKRRGEDVFNDGEEEEVEAKRRRTHDDQINASDLINSVGTGNAVTSVGNQDPVADFEALISRPSTSPSDVSYFLKQLLDASFSLVLSSPHARVRSRALACLSRARQGSIANQLHVVFNDFMRKLKTRLRAEGVAEFWDIVTEEAATGSTLDLISTADVSSSDVDSTHSKSIYESEVTSPLSEDKPQDEDDEDLFDMM